MAMETAPEPKQLAYISISACFWDEIQIFQGHQNVALGHQGKRESPVCKSIQRNLSAQRARPKDLSSFIVHGLGLLHVLPDPE
jgi:hypothetical protein